MTEGYDPYNNPGREQRDMIAAMEAAWQACLRDTSNLPELIYMTVDACELLNGRRSHTFCPYDNPAPAFARWWN